MDSFCGEARPTDVVALLDGSNPCLFNWVSCCCMEKGDEIRYSLGNVGRGCRQCGVSYVIKTGPPVHGLCRGRTGFGPIHSVDVVQMLSL